jgi:hypothetical protein
VIASLIASKSSRAKLNDMSRDHACATWIVTDASIVARALRREKRQPSALQIQNPIEMGLSQAMARPTAEIVRQLD